MAAAVVWFELWEPFPTFSLIGLVATLIGGSPIFKHAVLDILQPRMTMELSMTIALLAALVIGEFFTVLVIVFFVLVAEVLEGLTVGRSRRAIKDLLRRYDKPVRLAGRTHAVPGPEHGLGKIIEAVERAE